MTDTEGEKVYVLHELIVCFQRNMLNPHIIDDLAVQYAPISTFLTSTAIAELTIDLNGTVNTADLFLKRIFKKLKSTDNTSVSRSGRVVEIEPFWTAFVLQIPVNVNELNVKDALLADRTVVRYAHLNYVLKYDSNDTFYDTKQYSLHVDDAMFYEDAHINIRPAWSITTGSNDIKVGVLDNGIDATHEDFNTSNGCYSVVTDSENFENPGQPTVIPGGGSGVHGTFVAGIIGALRDNCMGVAGIAGGDFTDDDANCPDQCNKGVQLVDMMVGTNGISFDLVSEAIVMSALSTPLGKGLHVINCSFSSGVSPLFPSLNYEVWLIEAAVHAAFLNECIVVASRGNLGTDALRYPACFRDDWVISIGGSGIQGELIDKNVIVYPFAPNSSFGGGMDLLAPAVSTLIHTTVKGGGYAPFWATSSATPHATGVAALMLSAYPMLSSVDVQHIMEIHAGDDSYTDTRGWGLLNAGEAVKGLLAPKYKIQHESKTINISGVSPLYTNYPLTLEGLANASAVGDVYQVLVSNNHTLPINYDLESAWIRNNSCNLYAPPKNKTDEFGVFLEHAVEPYVNSQILFVDENSVLFEGYFYHITSVEGQTVDYWLPFDPTQGDAEFAYTLYLKSQDVSKRSNQSITGASFEYKLINNYSQAIDLQYTLRKQGEIKGFIYDINGRLIQQFFEKKENGNYKTSLSDYVNESGIYILRMEYINSEEQISVTEKLFVAN